MNMKTPHKRYPWADLTADHGPPQADKTQEIKQEFERTMAAATALLEKAAVLAGTTSGITADPTERKAYDYHKPEHCTCGAVDKATSAMYCDHANEMPAWCPCDSNCYCKFYSCRSPFRNAKNPPHICGKKP